MKILKKISLVFVVFCLSLTLFACGESANASVVRKINRTMTNLNSAIKNVQVISDDELIVKEIMPSSVKENENNNVTTKQIVNYNPNPINNNFRNVNTYYQYGNYNMNPYYAYGQAGYPYYNGVYANPYQQFNGAYYGGYMPNGFNGLNRGISNVNTYGLSKTNVNTYKKAKPLAETNSQNPIAYTNNEPLNQYFSKLSNLYDVASTVVITNNQLNTMRNNILANISLVQTLSNQVKTDECQLTDSQVKSIETLLENLNTTQNRLNLSKNEVKSELNSVKNLKGNYTGNVEQLSSKYVRLINSLNTRMTQYESILSCLNQLENCLNGYDCCLDNQTREETQIENISKTTCDGDNCFKDTKDFKYNVYEEEREKQENNTKSNQSIEVEKINKKETQKTKQKNDIDNYREQIKKENKPMTLEELEKTKPIQTPYPLEKQDKKSEKTEDAKSSSAQPLKQKDKSLKMPPQKKDIEPIRFEPITKEEANEIELENGKKVKYYSKTSESADGSVQTGQFFLVW